MTTKENATAATVAQHMQNLRGLYGDHKATANSDARPTLADYTAAANAAVALPVTSLEWAQEHARQGWRVFPLAPNSKVPVVGWKNTATNDPEAIASLWQAHPDAGVGVVAGDGLAVLDVDCKDGKDGNASLAELQDLHSPLPETRTVGTPSGGRHLYFSVPPEVEAELTNSAGRLGEGLDVRAGGKGYVAAPGTSINGVPYVIESSATVAPCPEWLLALMRPATRVDQPARPAPMSSHAEDRYATRALEGALSAITCAPEGERNDTLSREAFGLFRLVGANRLDTTTVEGALTRAAAGAGLGDGEVRATIQSARRGLESPNREGLPRGTAREVARAVGNTTSNEGPEPLRRSSGTAAPFPVVALGDTLRPAVEAVRQSVQAPLALCAQSALAITSLVVQRLYSVEVDGRTYPLSLWLLTVAESGERKSAADSVLSRSVKDWEREQVADYKRKLKKYVAEKAAFDKDEAKAAKAGLSAGEPPVPPMEATVITGDPTLEGLHKLLLRNRGWAGLLSDEGGQFVGGHAMSRDNAGKTVAGLSGLWDNGTADRVRGGDGVQKLYGKRLALHLMMQPVFAEELLSNPKASGQGFLARCLIAWPESTAGHRPYREGDVQAEQGMRDFHARLGWLLAKPEPLRVGEANELEPPPLTLDAEAKALWIRVHDLIEERMRASGEYETIKAWASKAAEQVLRIAGVLTVLDRDNPEAIHAPQVEAGAALVDWYLGEALRLRGVSSIPPEIRNAEALRDWCHERGAVHVHSAELVRLGPAAVRTADSVHAAMGVLERHGWAKRIEGGMSLDGKHRRNVWAITPKAEE